jgi:ankyrin repeat protein
MITVFQGCSDGDYNVVLRNLRNLSRTGFGSTLHVACLHGHVDIIRLLVGSGASIDEPDDEGLKPIHWACRNGSVDLVRVLISLGADREDLKENDEMYEATKAQV